MLKPVTVVQQFLTDLRDIRRSGAASGERSSYPPLTKLLEEVGSTLKPKVRCVLEIVDQGAGRPDIGLYTTGRPRGRGPGGRIPERGVVEVKGATVDVSAAADSDQVRRYWQRYRLVLVTNTRDFMLVGSDNQGRCCQLEGFQLADSPDEFVTRLETPRAFARDVGVGLWEYLRRVLSHNAALVEPADLAWLLASYARDGLARVETVDDVPSLRTVQDALEKALGVRFEGDRGAEFFRSTLVQTLFYGLFSAWVLWHRQTPQPSERFNWREAVWHLRVPVIQALYQQLSDPAQLEQLNLVEVLNWASAALDRVDQAAFFARFDAGEAVQYFYEPFLAAFDSQLRKQLGVWYTPTEIVRYMVTRVDRALKDDLGIADGLADSNVYILDPCCGTGAYLTEVLHRIAETLQGRGVGALAGGLVKEAAMTRVFGFEIMPAALVVAHLQIGLTLQNLGGPLADDRTERVPVYLTNALTGWDPTDGRPHLPFYGLQTEREQADRVKHEQPILVVLGNPPYNGFAGVAASDEERALSDVYRTVTQVQPPEGQGLNDLYVRFFRVAERRIVEHTGQGVVCYITNYSWLDGLSFTGMRERFLDVFDVIRIDNLHGDRIISEYAPDGRTSETIFALKDMSAGIKVGTSIVSLTKTAALSEQRILYRDFDQAKAAERRQALLDSLDEPTPDSGYSSFKPDLQLNLAFKPLSISDSWHEWPTLPELFPVSFPGVKTSRDRFLVDTDLDRLRTRIGTYFDPTVSNEQIARQYPAAMKPARGFNPRTARETLLDRGGPTSSGFVRYAYRPFDNRWLYWESDTKLLDEKRAAYKPHVFEGNLWLSAAQYLRKGADEPQAYRTDHMGSLHLIERGALMFPAWLHDDDSLETMMNRNRRPNLTAAAESYLNRLEATTEDLFHFVLAVLHDPKYRSANAGGLKMGWPRIPLPGWPDGDSRDTRTMFAASAEHGRRLAALLDSDTPIHGVTDGPILPGLAKIAVPSREGSGTMTRADFALSAGWGHYGAARAVMPGRGRTVERSYTAAELDPLGDAAETLGDTTFDIYLNENAYWCNVPSAVWNYKLGGYQVLKKWLSYREEKLLGRPLKHDEVIHFMNTARRIAALLLPPNIR